jgi:hypothetical protein
MHKPVLATTAVALLALAAAVAQAAPAAVAEPMEIEPEILSKMALQRAKARNVGPAGSARNGSASGAGTTSPFGCGAVNIGNIIGNGRPGFQPREVTVVITGDVINANNQCK